MKSATICPTREPDTRVTGWLELFPPRLIAINYTLGGASPWIEGCHRRDFAQ